MSFQNFACFKIARRGVHSLNSFQLLSYYQIILFIKSKLSSCHGLSIPKHLEPLLTSEQFPADCDASWIIYSHPSGLAQKVSNLNCLVVSLLFLLGRSTLRELRLDQITPSTCSLSEKMESKLSINHFPHSNQVFLSYKCQDYCLFHTFTIRPRNLDL